MDDIELKIESAFISFNRGGNFIQEIFDKPEKFLSGHDCMKLMNIYGIEPREVVLLAISHDFDVDYHGFVKLYKEQIKDSKILI